MSGVVATQLAATASTRLASLLLVSAVIPPPGKPLLSMLPLVGPRVLGPRLVRTGLSLPAKTIRSIASGVDAQLADRIVADSVPLSGHVLADRTDIPHWPGRRGYVITGADNIIPPFLQRRFARKLGGETFTLDAGHVPMLTAPTALIAAITAITR